MIYSTAGDYLRSYLRTESKKKVLEQCMNGNKSQCEQVRSLVEEVNKERLQAVETVDSRRKRWLQHADHPLAEKLERDFVKANDDIFKKYDITKEKLCNFSSTWNIWGHAADDLEFSPPSFSASYRKCFNPPWLSLDLRSDYCDYYCKYLRGYVLHDNSNRLLSADILCTSNK